MKLIRLLLTGGCLLAPAIGTAQEENLAKELTNPVAALISVPVQVNYDEDFGVDDEGAVLRINVQPVIPFSIGPDPELRRCAAVR